MHQRKTLRQRFEVKVDRSGGPTACHEWIGARNTSGYGKIRGVGRDLGAHRVALELSLDLPITGGMFVCHRCDNPSCVNPLHLFLGTCKDNMRDCSSKRRCNPILSVKQVREIRALRGIESQRSLARRFGVSQQHVCNIQHGKKWAYLDQGEA